MMAEVFRCSVLTKSELAGWYLSFYGLVMQYTTAFPKFKNSAMDNFSKLFQAELIGDICNTYIFSSITVILLFLMNLLPK
jgi:hypothetical protein